MALSKVKWNLICSKPERYYYHLNGDNVATTLIAPDVVRHHTSSAAQFFYYKRFPKWQLAPGVEGPGMMMAVVIDTDTQRVCTVFPVHQPKSGKEYDPNA